MQAGNRPRTMRPAMRRTCSPPHSRISAEAHPGVQAVLVRFFRGEAVADNRLTLPPLKFLVL